ARHHPGQSTAPAKTRLVPTSRYTSSVVAMPWFYSTGDVPGNAHSAARVLLWFGVRLEAADDRLDAEREPSLLVGIQQQARGASRIRGAVLGGRQQGVAEHPYA